MTDPTAGSTQAIPRDARLVALILASMGIQDCEPAVLTQLLEFAHRYTHDVLQDALVYADHAASRTGGLTVSMDDVQLAIQSRVNYSFTSPPSKEFLLMLAEQLNRIPLPPIPDGPGVRLPHPRHCLTHINFAIIPDPPPIPQEDDGSSDSDDGEADSDDAADGLAGRGAMDEDDDDDDNEVVAAAPEPRGTKRTLEEDEDYD